MLQENTSMMYGMVSRGQKQYTMQWHKPDYGENSLSDSVHHYEAAILCFDVRHMQTLRMEGMTDMESQEQVNRT